MTQQSSSASRQPTILVLGGAGFYGRYVVADLLARTSARIIIASRRRRNPFPDQPRVQAASCDLWRQATLWPLLQQADVLVHCAGPFHLLPLNPLRAAIAQRVPYVDLSEDRAFHRHVAALAPEIAAAGIPVLSGASAVPVMEALATELLRPRFERLTSIRALAAPDTRKHRGPAMFETLLYGVGRPFELPRGGDMVVVNGWTEGEWVTFPEPIGRRLTYLVLEMADIELLPDLFGVERVAFKAGSDQAWLNRLLHVAARLRMRYGRPRWERLTPLLRGISWLAGQLGRDEGAVIFEIGGERHGRPVTERLCVVAERDGGRIPALPAALAAAQMAAGVLPAGLLQSHRWMPPVDFFSALEDRGLALFWQPDGAPDWLPLSGSDLALPWPPMETA